MPGMKTRRPVFIAAILLVVLLACGIRIYAAQRLDIDYDEPVYLAAAVEYAHFMRAGDLKMLAWSENTYEHPALNKILFGVVLVTQRPLDRLPYRDLPRLIPLAQTAAGAWNLAARYLSVFFGSLAVLVLALVDPFAGLFLAVNTLSVKYTSEVYIEALPLLTSLLCGLTYLRWFSAVRPSDAPPQRGLRCLFASAVFLGMTAAAKYVYCIVGLVILLHFFTEVIRGTVRPRWILFMGGWLILSLLMFFAFDPYLWPHPISRLLKSIVFHEEFQDSRLVLQYHYPFWQPLRWLSAFPLFYNLRPASAFLINMDTLIFLLAVIGLPRLFRSEPFFFSWLVVGLLFLLAWNTKWPQYSLIILAPFSMAAASGILTIWGFVRRLVPGRSNAVI
jgi:hypothetical protein